MFYKDKIKQKISITLDEAIIGEIHKLADEDNRSFSNYINRTLAYYLKNNITVQKRLEKGEENQL